jgi:hypothetical protein
MRKWITVHGSHTITLRRNKSPKRSPNTANGDMAGKQGRPHNEVQERIFVFIESIDFDNLKL